MTRAELSELGLENLIGTEALRAYMHGYFMDNKLYQRAKMVAKPSMYEEYQKEKNRQKAKERKERRITLNRKKPEVNAELAAKLEESGGLADGRFSALFQNPDFEIDKNSEEFKRTHASGLGKRVESEEEESDRSDGSDGDAVFGEDFELLNTHDGENRGRRSEAASDGDSDSSDAEPYGGAHQMDRADRADKEEEEAYVGKKRRKEKEEKERIKPKGVRFFGVKENTKINLAASKQEVEREAAKRKEKRTMSLGKRMQGLEKRK